MTDRIEPRVSVLAATHDDPVRAAALLIFTKNTRLAMSPDGFVETLRRCQVEWDDYAIPELKYMAHTIRSSWEFLDITFMIQNVSRACAQQITRTRLASYAMQSQRVTDMTGVTWHTPQLKNADERSGYNSIMASHVEDYEAAIREGMKAEDARGFLPMNVHCNLVAKYNLRVLVDLIHARTSYRVQGEYQQVAQQMREQLLELWPWAEYFLAPRDQLAIDILDELATALDEPLSTVHQLKILVAKAKDQLEGH